MTRPTRSAGLPARFTRGVRLAWHFARGLATALLVFPFVAPARRATEIRRWSHALLGLVGVRLHVHGSLPGGGMPVLVVANHVSWLDIFAVRAVHSVRFVCNTDADNKKRDFYKAVRLALQGVSTYAEKLRDEAVRLANAESNPVRREELLKISRICARVPKERSHTFHEALQAIWICHVAINQESNNVSNSLGRLDQILYPLSRKGIEDGTLTPSQAVELVGCFYLKLADHEPMSPETAEELFGGSGSNLAITLGGVDSSGQDAVNDLTYVGRRPSR